MRAHDSGNTPSIPGTAPATTPASPDAAIILTGGRSTRMGRHKPAIAINGTAMGDRVIAAVRAANPNARIIVAGTDSGLSAPGCTVVPDLEPHAGPLAGIASAARAIALPDTATVCILAADMPYLTADAIIALTANAAEHGAACAVDSTGRRQQLTSAWRWADLRTQLGRINDPRNGPVKWLYRELEPQLVALPDAQLRDVDSPEDLPQQDR